MKQAPMVVNKKPRNDDIGIRPVTEIRRSRSWALYGRSGTGKTTLSATFPKPLLLLDVRDRGTDSIMDEEEIDVKDIETLADLEDAYYFIKEYPKKYKTVVIDTVTQLQQIFIEEVIGSKRRKDDKALGDWGSMSRREFGDVAAMMKEWTLNFRDLTGLGLETVFIAQERTSINEDDSNPDNMITPEVGPAVMPSVAMHLNGNVSIIGNTFIRVKRTQKLKGGKKVEREEPQYCLRIGPNPVYVTKIRKPRGVEAPVFMEDPTYQDIIDLIKGV